jgi:hypothetical protein
MMRALVRRLAAAIVLGALLAGCGTHSLVLNVDVLSFTPELQTPFTNIPTVPANTPPISGTQTLVDRRPVNLLAGLGDAASIDDVSFRLVTVASSTGGSGAATLRVFLADSSTDPLTTTPVLVQDLTFTSGTPDTVTTTISGDSRLRALFSKQQVQLSVNGTFTGPSSGAALSGASLRFVALDAVVIAGRKR